MLCSPKVNKTNENLSGIKQSHYNIIQLFEEELLEAANRFKAEKKQPKRHQESRKERLLMHCGHRHHTQRLGSSDPVLQLLRYIQVY